jgi:hypothetical protein
VTGRQTENQNAGRGQARDGTEDWRVRGTVMNGCWPGLCFALLLRYSILLCISPGSRYCQRAVVVRIAATRGQQEMKRLSASRRGDPGRALPLGGRTPVAGWRTGRVAELQIDLEKYPLCWGTRVRSSVTRKTPSNNADVGNVTIENMSQVEHQQSTRGLDASTTIDCLKASLANPANLLCNLARYRSVAYSSRGNYACSSQ